MNAESGECYCFWTTGRQIRGGLDGVGSDVAVFVAVGTVVDVGGALVLVGVA